MACADIQVLFNCADALWLRIFHVRLACSRKGGPLDPCPAEVIYTFCFLTGLTLRYSLLAGDSHALFRTYLIVSVAGIYGLFPLLFTSAGAVSINTHAVSHWD